jgi:type IV pilus assembly protein PilE
MKRETSRKGFTLVELMIVVAIVAILVALALPSYNRYILKGNRGEAQQLLMNWSNNQEIWRAAHSEYADEDDFAVPTHDKYRFTVTDETATTFTLTADPLGNQAKDEDRGVDCDPLTLNQSIAKTPTECW